MLDVVVVMILKSVMCYVCDNTVKCANCEVSNEKYGLSLNVNHVSWYVSKCESYKRIEEIQRSEYIK